MPSINQCITLFILLGQTIAAPTAQSKGLTFSISTVAVRDGLVTSPQHRRLNRYRRSGIEPPAHVIRAAGTTTARVAANPQLNDAEYLSPVTIGGKEFHMQFDTGSSDFWIFSDLLPKAQTSEHKLYTTNSSKKLNGYTWDISYVDGSGAKGLVYKDSATIGGATVTTQAIEAATSVSQSLQSDRSNDGLVGFGFSSDNTVKPKKQKTYFENLLPSLAAPVFTIDTRYHKDGQFDFGFINASKYTGSITYNTVDTSKNSWLINVSGYGVATSTITSSPFTALVDSGNAVIQVPEDIFNKYIAQVPGAEYNDNTGWYFPCNQTLPDLYFKIGSMTTRTPGKYLNYSPFPNAPKYCSLGVESSEDDFVLGEVFIKSQFIVFDYSGPRVGIASKKLDG